MLPLEIGVNKFVFRQKSNLGNCSFLRGDQFKKHFSRSVISIHSEWAEAQFTRKSRLTFLARGPAKSRRLLESNLFFIDVSPNHKMNISLTLEAFPHFIGERYQKRFLSNSKGDQEDGLIKSKEVFYQIPKERRILKWPKEFWEPSLSPFSAVSCSTAPAPECLARFGIFLIFKEQQFVSTLNNLNILLNLVLLMSVCPLNIHCNDPANIQFFNRVEMKLACETHLLLMNFNF